MFGMPSGDGEGGDKNDIMQQLLHALNQDDEVVRAQINDQRLLKLAEYDITQGYMKTNVTPDLFQTRFNEMKGLVKRGSFTLNALETDVYTRWGIQEGMRSDAPENTKRNQIGFSMDDVKVANIPVGSKENR